jgi:hypothetical protein
MADPKIAERYKYKTLPQAAKVLGMHQAKLRRRIKDRLFPEPTFINKYGLHFFDDDWIARVKIILKNSFEGNNKQEIF